MEKELEDKKSLLQREDLKRRKRVLRRLHYCTSTDVVEVKGRVACEVSGADELLITELLFNGVFNDLDVPQTAALLSCFVFEEKAPEMPSLTEELAGPLRTLQVESALHFCERIEFKDFKLITKAIFMAYASKAVIIQKIRL